MFNRKIVPDFTPRRAVVQAPIFATPPPQAHQLPERILISESSKPPPLPAPETPYIYYHVPVPAKPAPVMLAQTQRSLPDPPFLGSTLNGAASGFSPNLETFPALNQPYFAGGGASSASNWSLYPATQDVDMGGKGIFNSSYISTTNVNTNALFTSNISTSSIFADTISTNNLYTTLLSTNNLYANSTFSPFINVSTLDLDGNILTTAGEELLYNGQPIATVSSISTNVAAWSIYPATSTIIANSNDIASVKNIQLSTINGQPFTAQSSVSTWSQFPAISQVDFAQYNLNNVSTINGLPYTGAAGGPAVWSQYPATQTVDMASNSLNNVAGVNLSSVGTVALLTAGPGNTLNVNGVPVSTGGGANTWANFPAISTVIVPDQDFNMTTTTPGLSYKNANINANLIVGTSSNAPTRPDATFYAGTVTMGGLATPLTNMNVNSIGGINLTSATGIGISGGGGVTVSGVGGVSVSGLGNVALAGGNVEIAGAGGVLVNGTGAIVVTAGGVAVNGGGVSIAAGGCAITAGGLSIAAGTTAIGNVGAAGGGLSIYGSDLYMSPVGGTNAMIHTNYLTSNTQPMQITGVSTINGSPLTYISTSVGTFQGNVRFQAGTNLGAIVDIPGGNFTFFAPDNSFVKSIEGPSGGPISGPVEVVAGAGIEIGVSNSTFTFTNTKLAAGAAGTLECSDGFGNFVGATGLVYTPGSVEGSPGTLTANANFVPQTTDIGSLGSDSRYWSTLYADKVMTATSAIIPTLYNTILYDGAGHTGSTNQFLGWYPLGGTTLWQDLPSTIIPISLTNKVIATPVGTPSISTITWTTGQAGNKYVPLVPDTSVTYRPPVAPPSGQTGWRFNKTYTLTPVSAGTLLTVGATYTIVTPGSINWTAIGAAASTAGTQFTYNGVAITGSSGSVTENSKISWYSINLLYNVAPPIYGPPAFAFAKAALRSAWFLVRFNADIAVQGSLAIQIDTYAYRFTFPGPPFPYYTGRWAYSFPNQQNVGFTGAPTTNLTTSTATPRLKAGFTYLLYAGDYSSVGMPGPYYSTSSSYLAGGAGLFAPSQNSVTNTLKDPYDIYPDFPHIGLTSCSYNPNATQPPYGGANPYSDPAAVEVASIYLNTSSTAPYSGVGQTVTDFTVINMGYTTSFDSVSYPMSWVP